MTVAYLDLADFLVVAEVVLATPAETLARVADLGLADSALHAPAAGFGGEEFYPDLAVKAAVLCTRLVKNHALPDGNKRTALLCTIEFCRRNGCTWTPPPGDEDGEVTAGVIWELAAGPAGEKEVATLASWIVGLLVERGAVRSACSARRPTGPMGPRCHRSSSSIQIVPSHQGGEQYPW